MQRRCPHLHLQRPQKRSGCTANTSFEVHIPALSRAKLELMTLRRRLKSGPFPLERFLLIRMPRWTPSSLGLRFSN